MLAWDLWKLSRPDLEDMPSGSPQLMGGYYRLVRMCRGGGANVWWNVQTNCLAQFNCIDLPVTGTPTGLTYGLRTGTNSGAPQSIYDRVRTPAPGWSVPYPSQLPRPRQDPRQRPKGIPDPVPVHRPLTFPAPQPRFPYELLPHVIPHPFSPRGYAVPSPVTAPQPAPRPLTVIRMPPGPGVKEAKVRAGPLFAALFVTGKMINWVTESNDVVQALYDALPWKYQRILGGKRIDRVRGDLWPDKIKGAETLPLKLKVLYEHWDKIDWNEAIENLVVNQIEDKVIGSLAGPANKFGGTYGRPVGFGVGGAL